MTVHFVGAGPGAADLLTVRATALLAVADVVLYPGTYIDRAVLAHTKTGARLVDTQDLDLDQITTEMAVAHARGEDVVRLTSGDPSVYSALHEQARRLDAVGVPWDVTPGVPAYAAAAARVGAELTVPELVQSVILTRTQARSTAMPDSEALANFAATRSTLALHLAITRVRAIADELAEHYGPTCPVVVAYRVSQPSELILRGTLGDIADAVEGANLKQAAVILVGPALAEDVPPGSSLRSEQGGTPRGANESFLYDPARDRTVKARTLPSDSGTGPHQPS